MTVLESFGHSCFRITAANGYQVVFDPYETGSVPGVDLPADLTADAVYCSHGHADHNAAHLVHLRQDGPDNPFVMTEVTVPHDDAGGAKRGMNVIRKLQAEDFTVIHYGDIGRDLTPEETEILKGADLILIPVGGYFTIDAAQADRIIRDTAPKTAVLMHYRSALGGYDVIAHIDDVRMIIPAKHCPDWTMTVEDHPGIWTMEPYRG